MISGKNTSLVEKLQEKKNGEVGKKWELANYLRVS
jgi:hypothetical protein